MAEFTSEIIDIIPRTSNVKSFRMNPNKGLSYDPGQYMLVTIDVNGAEITKPLSFSSSPTESDYIEFTKKLTDSSFSNVLDNMKTGDTVKIKMPLGRLIFKCDLDRTVFLSGGIGITPFRSMFKYATDMKCSSNIMLLYGNNTAADIIFKDDFDHMESENKNFKAVYTITKEDSSVGSWQGCRGNIDENMIKTSVPDYKDRIFFICGPPVMVDCMKEMLKDSLGISDECIKTEQFVGY